jgi:two-component system chemotaxis response regulator CheV
VITVEDMTFGVQTEAQDAKAHEKTLRTVVFGLGSQVFAVRVDMVREILLWQEIRAVPHTHRALLGVATIRGEVIPVIDIGAFFRIGDLLPVEKKKMIVLELQEGLKAAFAVDEVRRIFDLEVDRMDRSLKGVILGEFLDCVIKHDDGDILMPDPGKIMEALRLETARLSRFAAEEIVIDGDGEEVFERAPGRGTVKPLPVNGPPCVPPDEGTPEKRTPDRRVPDEQVHNEAAPDQGVPEMPASASAEEPKAAHVEEVPAAVEPEKSLPDNPTPPGAAPRASKTKKKRK